MTLQAQMLQRGEKFKESEARQPEMFLNYPKTLESARLAPVSSACNCASKAAALADWLQLANDSLATFPHVAHTPHAVSPKKPHTPHAPSRTKPTPAVFPVQVRPKVAASLERGMVLDWLSGQVTHRLASRDFRLIFA